MSPRCRIRIILDNGHVEEVESNLATYHEAVALAMSGQLSQLGSDAGEPVWGIYSPRVAALRYDVSDDELVHVGRAACQRAAGALRVVLESGALEQLDGGEDARAILELLAEA